MEDGLDEVGGQARQTEHPPHVRSNHTHRLGQVIEEPLLRVQGLAAGEAVRLELSTIVQAWKGCDA